MSLLDQSRIANGLRLWACAFYKRKIAGNQVFRSLLPSLRPLRPLREAKFVVKHNQWPEFIKTGRAVTSILFHSSYRAKQNNMKKFVLLIYRGGHGCEGAAACCHSSSASVRLMRY